LHAHVLFLGEIIDGLDDLRDLENGGNIRMTDCGIMTDEPSYLSY
jgi:hypothetical protein